MIEKKLVVGGKCVVHRRGAGRESPGVRTSPAMARMICEIHLNPRTFFVVRGEVGIIDNAVQTVYTAVCRTFVTFRTVQLNG